MECGWVVAESSVDEATEALLFLVVGLKHVWKCPIGYFLTNKLNGDAQASLIRSALSLLAYHGFQVWSVACDCTSSNLDTFRLLGCTFAPKYDNIKASFPHPKGDHQVYAILDPCHMVKLAKNTLGDLGNLKDNDEGIIDWSFHRRLVKLQDEESLSLGNSLNINHIAWQKHKMGSSVANALEFLKDDLKLPAFKGCGPTIQFIRKIDRVFHVVNSRNPYGRGFKSPLRHSNISLTESIFKETGEHLL